MKKTLIFFIVLLGTLTAFAQDFHGSVFYRKTTGAAEPLPFAQIYILEKSKLIEADENGRFDLKITEKTTLVATYVGYTKDTVTVEPGMTKADFFLSGENDLDESVVTGRQAGISKLKSVKTEVITSAGLCKMACCALAESFENSASVTVGYSDAVTGARQIKLLGLSGTYTQMLDENRPVMRGLANPFGLSFVPGQWLESIQIAKGPSSVINGLEAITGQINMEHRKPTDETPLFVQLYGSLDKMFEANIASALQMNERWSVINMAHVGGTAARMDHNGDGFRDEPENLQLNFTSRWLYYAPNGMQIRFGARYINDRRIGGQMDATKDNFYNLGNGIWGSYIVNKGINPYFKIGVPLNEDNSSNIALVVDLNHHEFDSFFGLKNFRGKQNSAFANLIYQNEFNDYHKVEFGLTAQYDDIDQILDKDSDIGRREGAFSAFGEYTFTLDDRLTFVGGANLEYNTLHRKWLFAPRANVKYSVTDDIIVRALGGRGYRTANIITDNLGVMSTSYRLSIDNNLDLLEDAWTFGANATFYLPFGAEEGNTFLSFDYFHNRFNKQVIVDQELGTASNRYIGFYNLSGLSFTNTYQADFSVDPIERFNITATFRYSDARVSLKNQGLVERPMTSRFKGVLNMQYSTAMSKWIFDVTAQINGPMRLPAPAAEAWGMEESPVYPMFFAQVTRKFKGIDIYAGGENLGNYRQKEAIINPDASYADKFNGFNASCVWGPLMGARVYAGLRFTLWK
ncbi:MAG: carboxypeptidase-like regulatory domain-containing protein [Bacteroidales bacterium]|nr:carboxypeptidase-like regulatory domain-containing protein [Candidatus Cacconaster merdequi]